MQILSTKWGRFKIGLISLLILIYLQSWLIIIALICLFTIHPKSKVQGDGKNKDFWLLITLPIISLILGGISAHISDLKKEEAKTQSLVIIQNEERRINNALTWNIDKDPSLNANEKIFVKKAAKNFIKNEKTCFNLNMGGKSTTYKDEYYLHCKDKNGQYFKIYFTEKEINNNRILRYEQTYDRTDAGFLCYQAIRQRMKFPDTVVTQQQHKDRFYVNGDTKFEEVFTAKNAFGINVKHRSVCIVSNIGNVDIKITEE